MLATMDTVLDRPWTTDSFLAWEDQQEGKFEFDGRRIIPMTGGSLAHQRIVANVWLALMGLLGDRVLSGDTATTDRIDKLIDYAAVPSLRSYVLLEQTAVGATLLQRQPGAEWIASAHISGALTVPGIDIALPLDEIYRGLTFPAP